MNLRVYKQGEEYFVTFLQFKTNIKQYYVQKSTDLITPEKKDFHFDLLNNNVDIYNGNINIFSPPIKLEPLNDVKHYYKIVLITDNGIEYPFYVDYNKLYGIDTEENIYHYNFMKNIFFDIEKKHTKFYIKGIYGDIHLIDLVDIKNKKEAFFKVPKKTSLSSDVYEIIVEINGQRVFKGKFPIVVKDYIDFVVNCQDFGETVKVNVNPKFSYSTIDRITIKFGNEKIREVKRNKLDLNTIIRDASFYVPVSGFNSSKSFLIEYEISEPINSTSQTLLKNATFNVCEDKEVIEIYDIKSDYDFNTDTCTINWKNKSKKELNYLLEIGGSKFYTKDRFIVIENFKKFNNNNVQILSKIKCSKNKKELSEVKTSTDFFINNYNFIYLSNLFTPVIDYSQSMYCDKPFGKLRWSAPNFKHYTMVNVKTIINKRFLDEFSKPWLKSFILDKPVNEFDSVYTNYEQEYEYNFSNGKVNSKKVNQSQIVYDLSSNGFDIVTNENFINIPLWFNQTGNSYEVEVVIYDMFNKEVGRSNTSFTVKDYDVKDIQIENFRINRNQYLQFGENGTVGLFHEIENPRPIDVRNSYADEFKTFLGTQLNDKTNIDHSGNSMFYYFNTKENDYLDVRYERTFNFYKMLILIFKDETQIYSFEHIPRGNSFDENLIRIEKNKFTTEGEYKMKIQTFSSNGQASRAKEVSFFVYNENPEKPFVRIKADDYYDNEGEITINKKYFEMEVTNNDLSKKYSGWKFKETHFFFRTLDVPFLPFADYVVQTNIGDGSIVFKNNTPIENGDYECKVVNYDYAGNASDPHIFQFKLRSEIKITPYELFTNKPRQNMKWNIKKSQDTEGFYYFFRYSKDGITYNDYPPEKCESPYYINTADSKEIELDLEWLKDINGYFEGYYKLVCYEYSKKHPNGQPQYEFESPIVEVNELANPSNPVYSKPINGKVSVFNQSSHLEWSYTNDLNNIIFETVHNEMVIDNPDTPNIEGMNYKIVLIEPHVKGQSANTYQAIINQPEQIGVFQIDNIATKCGIDNQKEGVWELRFITTDKYGNTNESRGYYTYFISLVKRSPVLNNVTIANGTGSKYFGLYSDIIGFYVDATNIYKDIENYTDYKDKFPIINYDTKFIENPFNNQYTVTVKADDNSCISILSKLTESDKATNSKDGRYNVLITARDPLGRLSQQVDRSFYIDTTTNAEINFINNNSFITKTIDLKAVAVDKVKKVYYKTADITSSAPEWNLEEIKKWKNVEAKDILVGPNTYYGVEILSLEYLTDGYKTIFYAIEEDSGNIGQIRAYTFRIDTTNMLIPNFDYDNRIYFSRNDDYIELSWNNTNEAVNKFDVKLDKIQFKDNGEVEVVKSYAIQVDKISSVIPVGPGESTFVSIGSERSISFKVDPESVLVTGQYMLSVKGYNIYGSHEMNNFIFQIDNEPLIDISTKVINNRITLENNMITWESVRLSDFYEISYDNKNWIKTTENKFFVNTELVQRDSDGMSYIYLRWVSKSGVYSQASKISLSMSLDRIKNPIVEFFTDNITTDNRILKWNVIVENPEKTKGIFYSFDKTKWLYKPVTGISNTIINDVVKYPVEDGIYDIFVLLVDEDPSVSSYFNKSDMVHSYCTVFAKEIDTPVFTGFINGETLSNPTKLFIENKQKNVKYYIYVNGRLVEEGYEISSSTLRKFSIIVKAKKHGIEKVYELITESDDMHVWSLCHEPYKIDVNNAQIIVSIDHENTNMIIESTPSLNSKQVILFREKGNNESKWNVIKKGDSLSLLTEWEFHISTITVI